MDARIEEVIRRHARPIDPLPTETAPQLNRLEGVKAVLFDLYGTLFVSAVGDISLQSSQSDDQAVRESLVACGIREEDLEGVGAAMLNATIASHQDRRRQEGIEFPEVDIEDVWSDVLQQLQVLPNQADRQQIAPIVAVEYEVRVNPVWPMPNAVKCLNGLRNAGIQLGIVSNAQAMTQSLFPALLNASANDLGFDPDLQNFSYLHGESKPGSMMFKAAADALQARGIETEAAVFVGNDMLKDVWAAQQLGFRTILFAGDQRSLRWRSDDQRAGAAKPDAVVTNLLEIHECIG